MTTGGETGAWPLAPMPAPGPEPTVSTPLLGALRGLLSVHRPAFRRERSFLRMQALLLGSLFSFSRRTVT